MKSALFSIFCLALVFINRLDLWTAYYTLNGAIDVDHAYDLVSKGAVVYDVRSPEEIKVSSLKGAIPFNSQIKVPTDQPVLFICTLGARSHSIYSKFKKNGYSNVHNVAGGYFRWLQQGHFLHANGKPTNIVHPYSQFFALLLDGGQSSFALSAQPEGQN